MSVLFTMNWKSTTLVSGAGLLATWLASNPPANTMAPAPAAAPVQASQPDIQREAERLQSKMRQAVEFTQPSRNPFRFGERAPVRSSAPAYTPPAVADVAPAPPPVTVRLSGVAIDAKDGRQEKTAILSTSEGLVFAKEGDAVAGYRVGTISEDVVELVRPDGSILSLR